MRALVHWLESLIDRILFDREDGVWRPIAGHRVAARGDEDPPRFRLTIDGEQRPKSIDAWPDLGDGDRLAIEALLAQPAPQWFHEGTRELATAPPRQRGRSVPCAPATSIIIRGFDGSWTPGAGGWLRLRFRGGTSREATFGAAEGERFSQHVIAASAPEAIFDPRTGSIRSRRSAPRSEALAMSP